MTVDKQGILQPDTLADLWKLREQARRLRRLTPAEQREADRLRADISNLGEEPDA